MATLEQITKGDALPPEHLVETLGALMLWAMAEPGRSLEVSEVYGRAPFNRAVSVTVKEPDCRPRSWQMDPCAPIHENAATFLLDLVKP